MAKSPAPPGLWVTQSEIASIKGVSKQAISKRWNKFVDDGLLNVRSKGARNVVLLAEWDAVANDFTDPAKLVARETTREIRRGRRREEVLDPKIKLVMAEMAFALGRGLKHIHRWTVEIAIVHGEDDERVVMKGTAAEFRQFEW